MEKVEAEQSERLETIIAILIALTTLIGAVVTVAIYAALLIVTGELGSEEAAMARRIVARRRGK